MMTVSLTRVVLVTLVVVVNTVDCKERPDNNDDAIMRFESSPKVSFQGCLLSCLDKDLCCSCKESGKRSMNAALINDLGKTCATKDVLKCSKTWLDSLINAERGGASNCTSQHNIEREVGRCISQCNGKEWSEPINPYLPEHQPGPLMEDTDLAEYIDPDFSDFCADMRTEGILCTVYRRISYTAGNTLCRSGNVCGYHGYKYSWCYTDFSGRWDYCCTGSCGFEQNTSYMWCKAGSKWQYCGNAGTRDIQGRHCLSNFPCGMHQEHGKASYYWCYVDANKNWDRCCEPWDPCSSKGEWYGWCYTGYKKKTNWRKCRKV